MNITLLENSHSFLEEALEKAVLAEKEPIQWKFAIFSMVQSLELLLKERLKKEHRVFIYQNIDKRTNTVGLDLAIKRLKEIADLQFSSNDLDAINRAKLIRHQIVHHEFKISPEDIKLVFAKLLGFSMMFHKKEFEISLEDIVKESAWNEAISMIEFENELCEKANELIIEESIYPEFVKGCPNCINETFVIQDDINRCYVFGYQEDIFECRICGKFCLESERYEFPNDDICIKCYEEGSGEGDY